MRPSPHPETASAMSQPALQLARAAISRWRGGQSSATPLPRDRTHVSLQASYLDTVRKNLAVWRAQGGFAQEPGAAAAQAAPANACID